MSQVTGGVSKKDSWRRSLTSRSHQIAEKAPHRRRARHQLTVRRIASQSALGSYGHVVEERGPSIPLPQIHWAAAPRPRQLRPNLNGWCAEWLASTPRAPVHMQLLRITLGRSADGLKPSRPPGQPRCGAPPLAFWRSRARDLLYRSQRRAQSPRNTAATAGGWGRCAGANPQPAYINFGIRGRLVPGRAAR